MKNSEERGLDEQTASRLELPSPPVLPSPLPEASSSSSFSSSNNNNGSRRHLHHHHHHKRASLALRQVERVTKRAALVSKQKIWDSNDASIDVAQSAVDQWEAAYSALRGLLVATAHSARGLYGAAKAGAVGLEDGFLVPVRDWVLLPAFSGVEHVAGETVGFLQSDQAKRLAASSLEVVRQVPYVGDNVLAPALVMGVDWTRKAWEIAQYPIPSKAAVRESVDFILTGTKWVLTTAGRETYFYAKRMDANVTRTLMHTQWKVLGSGPYSSLDPEHKQEVLDHLCERYLSIPEAVARYELAAHIRAHNRRLYRDLVATGLLRERGGELTKDDEWLADCPVYRELEESPFLLPSTEANAEQRKGVVALWFRLPYQNGKRPGKDTPWVRFPVWERQKLEERYISVLRGLTKQETTKDESFHDRIVAVQGDKEPETGVLDTCPSTHRRRYPTIAHWYVPDLEKDLLIDQKRQAVSFLPSCPQCHQIHDENCQPPLLPKHYGELCHDCSRDDYAYVDPRFSPPPLSMIMRPTLWRFHGSGDELRRAVWVLDTKRHGLQPYSEDSAAVLEDAYLFLKWRMSNDSSDSSIEGSLLTVQVTSPDGSEQQLVQFSSLNQATAIQKTLGGAISLFKRRVYRGASMVSREEPPKSVSDQKNKNITPKPIEGMPLQDAKDEDWVDVSLGDSTSTIGMDGTEENDTLLSLPKSDLLPSDTEEDLPEETTADHLVLVVHGIGEMMRSIDLFGMQLPNLSSIVDCCGFLRNNHAEMHVVHPRLQPQGRVEYLPVEWHEAFAIQSQRHPSSEESSDMPWLSQDSRETTVRDVSLKTIPQIRAFANDTLMDVLYFMSPEHHDMIIDIVTSEMNFMVHKFREITGFEGRVSLIGHSLGSVIAWDILAHRFPRHSEEQEVSASSSPSVPSTSSLRSRNQDQDIRSVSSKNSSMAVECADLAVSLFPPHSYPQLDFDVDNAFMLGSPIAVFVMIRNQHLSEDFCLEGCSRVFNIFHPYDPVAYRIEPVLDHRNSEVEPKIITRWNGGFRVQYQTKRLWNKLVDETLRTQQTVIDAVEERLSRLGLLDEYAIDSSVGDEEDECSGYSSDGSRIHRVTCGSLNEGRRVDYMLQEKELESANEYVSALAAHSSYWMEKDLSLFLAQQLLHSKIEASIADTIVNVPVQPPQPDDSVRGMGAVDL